MAMPKVERGDEKVGSHSSRFDTSKFSDKQASLHHDPLLLYKV